MINESADFTTMCFSPSRNLQPKRRSVLQSSLRLDATQWEPVHGSNLLIVIGYKVHLSTNYYFSKLFLYIFWKSEIKQHKYKNIKLEDWFMGPWLRFLNLNIICMETLDAVIIQWCLTVWLLSSPVLLLFSMTTEGLTPSTLPGEWCRPSVLLGHQHTLSFPQS